MGQGGGGGGGIEGTWGWYVIMQEHSEVNVIAQGL